MNPGGDIPSLVDVFIPDGINAAIVVPDSYALKRVRFRLGVTLRTFVTKHFNGIGGGSQFQSNRQYGFTDFQTGTEKTDNPVPRPARSVYDITDEEINQILKGETPQDVGSEDPTPASRILFDNNAYNRRGYRYWNPFHFNDPRMSSIDDVLQYARQIDQIHQQPVDGVKPETDNCRTLVQALLVFYEDDNCIAALARRHDPKTWLMQLKNNYLAAEINDANERAFMASVALAGAILSCVSTPPKFRLRARDEGLSAIPDYTPDAGYMQGVTSFLFEADGLKTTEYVNSMYDEFYKDNTPDDAKEKFCDMMGVVRTSDEGSALYKYVSDNLSYLPGSVQFETTDTLQTKWFAELVSRYQIKTEILDRMQRACQETRSTASSLTLSELALICVAW